MAFVPAGTGAGQGIKLMYAGEKRASQAILHEEAVIYRGGGTNPGNYKPGKDGVVSLRDSLSNPWPLKPGESPVFGHGDSWAGVKTCDLPPPISPL
jgi:hypothetical protein